MLRILGSPKQLCNGLTRRDLLRVGGLGLAGLALPEILQLQELSAKQPDPVGNALRGVPEELPKSFGKAKAVILMHLYGAPSQLEFVDPKPDAPVEIRGDLASIPSSLPGCRVCELLPNLAKVMDRTTVLRSMTHPYPIHGVAYALTGVPAIDVGMELRPHDPGHWPFFGSAVEYVESKRRERPGPVPNNVALPFRFSSKREGEVPRAGPYAAFLGSEFDPVWTEYIGTPTKTLTKTLRDLVYTGNDPYIGLDEQSHFSLPSSARLQPEVTLDRLNRRQSLLSQFNQARPALAAGAEAGRLSRHQQSAVALLESGVLAKALDVRLESSETREMYGMTLFGQSCLAARRLVEAGSKVVSVFWDEYGLAGMGWDTHWNHYPRMKVELCPGLDLAWYGLITDLDRRGLLDDVLVVCTSEHGRTPKINAAQGGGRDHWSRVYSSICAGGGMARGRVVGASDREASDVADRPISPKDLLATMYHLLGIDPHYTVRDRGGRPLPLVDGQVLADALG